MYRDYIFCLDSSYKSVGEWLSSSMKNANMNRADLVYELNSKHGYGVDGQGIDPTFISKIVTGKEKIPQRFIPAFCRSLGLNKSAANYYTAEILRLTLPEEVSRFVINPMNQALKEAKKEWFKNEIESIEKSRAEAIQRFNENPGEDDWLGYTSVDAINCYYNSLIYTTKQTAKPDIRVGFMRGVTIDGAMHRALNGDSFHLWVFFNKDLRPVDDMVAMARLYWFFRKNGKNCGLRFEEVFDAICMKNIISGNETAFAWKSSLDRFSRITEGFEYQKIKQILNSDSEIINDFGYPEASQWFCNLYWKMLNQLFERLGVANEVVSSKKDFFYQNFIAEKDEYGIVFHDKNVYLQCLSGLPRYELEDAADDLMQSEYHEEKVVDVIASCPGMITIKGKTLVSEAYISGWLKNYLMFKKRCRQ